MERCMRMGRAGLQVALTAILLLVTGCRVGPEYVRPPVPSPPAYKEIPQAAANGSELWRTTQPKDGTNRGPWFVKRARNTSRP